MCEKKTNQSEQNAKAGKPPAVSRDCADGFLPIKRTITSLVMIATSLCNYTILSAAAKNERDSRYFNECCNHCDRCGFGFVCQSEIW